MTEGEGEGRREEGNACKDAIVCLILLLLSLTFLISSLDNANRPYSPHPPSLHAIWDRWDKCKVTWDFRGQTNDKICQYE